MSFTPLGLPTALLTALEQQQYRQATPIQSQAIPAILERKNILGIAQTGSGKTASFVLPILTNLQEQPKVRNRHPAVLVLAPTRELAVQINQVFQLFSQALSHPIKTLAVYGGVSINPQMMDMNGVQVLVATPGRLLDLLDSNAVGLSAVKTLVLDEADKMLNLGFQEEVNKILELVPKRRQNLLFSATLSPDLDRLSTVLMKDPVVINIETKETEQELIHQSGFFVSEERKGPLLRYLIKTNDYKQVLVFTSSGRRADNVANKLLKNGIKAASIHGKKTQSERNSVLNQFKTGKIRVLVATDLLSRGIDIAFLPCVINYELPRSPKDYIHRIGRTGRAENPGVAITLVVPDDLRHFKLILKKNKLWLTMTDSDAMDLRGY
ncbi:MAG: DEAD/DEAH box helicase [Bacteroidota bacterium]